MERYTVCGHSAIGKSHEIKGMKCQDNCYFKVTENIIVAAVADGLSSSKYSDIASRIAVKTIVNYCIKNINYKDKEEIILEKIKRSFEQALLQIELKAGEDDLNFYDTTVSVPLTVRLSFSVAYAILMCIKGWLKHELIVLCSPPL